MLVAKNILTHDYYLKVRQKGVNIFLYNEIDFIPAPKEEDNEILKVENESKKDMIRRFTVCQRYQPTPNNENDEKNERRWFN